MHRRPLRITSATAQRKKRGPWCRSGNKNRFTRIRALLFDAESKKRLKERSQLHRIIAQNCWLFGEEYNLSVDDQSLTEVLRKHRKLLGDNTVIDERVKHVSKERGIVDLVLSRAIRRHKADELTHLVVELKAPKVKIDRDEITRGAAWGDASGAVADVLGFPSLKHSPKLCRAAFASAEPGGLDREDGHGQRTHDFPRILSHVLRRIVAAHRPQFVAQSH